MKAIFRLLGLILMVMTATAVTSCEKSEPGDQTPGNAEFAIQIPSENVLLKSGTATDSAMVSYHLLVSVTDNSGTPIFTDKLIPVYIFGTGFISEKLELQPGEYQLTKFMVIDPSGKVILASPVEGSPLAYLVNDPLPIGFVIRPNMVTTVVPEVLPVNDQTPDKFGYLSFGIQIIKPLEFYAFAYLDNPLIMAPTTMTEAKLTVFARDGWHYSFKLNPMVNRIVVRGGSDKYILLVEKEGYNPQKFEISGVELAKHTKYNPLGLAIPWGVPNTYTMVLQPGPEKGKDAMISNLEPDKNFGMHKFFEATFLTEPILTVMRSNHSIIWFDKGSLPNSAVIKKVVMTLHFAPSLTTDSIFNIPGTINSTVPFRGGVLQQVVEPWEESKVTWGNQPSTVVANQVFIPRVNTNNRFVNVDVTSLFVPWQEIAAPNYGMLFKQWPDDSFPGFRFASSDYPVAEMRPKLTIIYSLF